MRYYRLVFQDSEDLADHINGSVYGGDIVEAA
jgi:hypothetical protein